MEPRLPQDLERTIFETAARSDRLKTLPILMLVAHRVRIWMNFIRYEVLVIAPSLHYDYKSVLYHHSIQRPSGPQTSYVKHLLYDRNESLDMEFQSFLRTCHNLQSLALWGSSVTSLEGTVQDIMTAIQSPLRTVSPPALRYLSAPLGQIFPDGKVDWKHPILTDLTHLDVLDHPNKLGEWTEENNITCLKNLKYAYFGEINDERVFPLEFFTRCLEGCSALELMMLPAGETVAKNEGALPKTRKVLDPNGVIELVPEDRVVVDEEVHTYVEWVNEWYWGVSGEEDTWTRAERIVQQRRLKKLLEIDAPSQVEAT